MTFTQGTSKSAGNTNTKDGLDGSRQSVGNGQSNDRNQSSGSNQASAKNQDYKKTDAGSSSKPGESLTK